MNRHAQTVAPLSGKRQNSDIQGLPMNDAAMSGADKGPDFSDVKDLISKIEGLPAAQLPNYAQVVMSLAQTHSDTPLRKPLYVLSMALQYNSDPKTYSRRFATPQDAIAEVKKMIDVQDTVTPQNSKPQSGGMDVLRAAASGDHAKKDGGKPQEHQQGTGGPKQKTKSRNTSPYKVLMGKVGKLLDANVPDHRIRQFLMKDAIFDADTIDDCIQQMKQLQRKDHRKDEEDPSRGMAYDEVNAEENEGIERSNGFMSSKELKRWEDPEFRSQQKAGPGRLLNKQDLGDMLGKMQMAFNLNEYNKTAQNKSGRYDQPGREKALREAYPNTDYGTEPKGEVFSRANEKTAPLYANSPDVKSRSTSTLFASLHWLESLVSYGKSNKQGDGKEAADKKGAASQIREIKSELKGRGFTKDEIDGVIDTRTGEKEWHSI